MTLVDIPSPRRSTAALCAAALACAAAMLLALPEKVQAQRSVPTSSMRIGVIVGANAAVPGRRALRYAHRDARSVARALQDLGGFSKHNLYVLLEPSPQALLQTLDRALQRIRSSGKKGMLFFYYSGHSTAQALYPSGQKLAIAQIRKRLSDRRAAIRVGLIDACRGGGWTGSKGLSQTESFEVEEPMDLLQQGSIFIASSSGLEDAHESELLKGSFFTHHFVAGLRGAADTDRNGIVTFTEGFDYAKELTIRDTAVFSDTPQHPSFHIRLRGRRSLPLTRYKRGTSLLLIEQRRGPLQVVHLETGMIVAETKKGKGRQSIALPRGDYLVRRSEKNGSIRAKEVHIVTGQSVSMRENELKQSQESFLFTKSAEPVNLELLEEPTGWDRAELALYQAAHAGMASLFVCLQFDCPLRASIPSATLGSAVGAGLAFVLTRDGIRPGQAVTLNSSTSWGLWLGAGTSLLFDTDERSLFGSMAAGQALGFTTGLLLNTYAKPDATDWTFGNSLAFWGAGTTSLLFGALGAWNRDSDIPQEAIAGTYLGVTIAAGATGFALARRVPMSRSRALIIDAAGLMGGFIGTGLAFAIRGNDVSDGALFGSALGLGLAGLGVGAYLTRNWDNPKESFNSSSAGSFGQLSLVPSAGGAQISYSGIF